MKKYLILILTSATFSLLANAKTDQFYPQNEYYQYEDSIGEIIGYAGGVGDNTNQGIHVSGKMWRNGSLEKTPTYTFASWASGCANYTPGTGITGSGTDSSASAWQDPSKAFGKATSSDTADVVVLGDGGSITMSFNAPITNGSGYDFAVFENALNDTFLEFAFVEVSTNGVDFIRFPNFYLGYQPVGSDSTEGGGVNDPTLAYNLGSKYRVGYGNGYDLNELALAYQYAIDHFDSASNSATADSAFSTEYTLHLIENFLSIDLSQINYVKLIDIIGDSSTLDSKGDPIYDAYPSTGTPGFDLSGIGVINQAPSISEPPLFSLLLPALLLPSFLKKFSNLRKNKFRI